MKSFALILSGYFLGILSVLGLAYFAAQKYLPPAFRDVDQIIRIVKLQNHLAQRVQSNSQLNSEKQIPKNPVPNVSWKNYVRKVDSHNYIIRRKGIKLVMDNNSLALTSARVVPNLTPNQGIDGFKFASISAKGLFEALGFKRGDVLRSINGESLSNPSSSLQTVANIQNQSNFKVLIDRRGQPFTIYYKIR